MNALEPPLIAGLFERSGLPSSWRDPVVTVTVMLILAGLDFCGAICAKEYAEHRRSIFLLFGLLSFVILFVVYAHSLKIAELSIVTIGWVVFLQIGLLLIDRMRYGVDMSTAKWCAVGLILVLQAFLILAPSGSGH